MFNSSWKYHLASVLVMNIHIAVLGYLFKIKIKVFVYVMVSVENLNIVHNNLDIVHNNRSMCGNSNLLIDFGHR